MQVLTGNHVRRSLDNVLVKRPHAKDICASAGPSDYTPTLCRKKMLTVTMHCIAYS